MMKTVVDLLRRKSGILIWHTAQHSTSISCLTLRASYHTGRVTISQPTFKALNNNTHVN